MLVNCTAHEDGKKLAEIHQHKMRSYLGRPGCFI